MIETFPLARQRVRLLVLHHLQAMLDRAQKHIGGLELACRLGGDVAARGQCIEHAQGRPPAQRRVASAEDELLGLHEELDFANAAAPELDVVACDRDRPMPALGVNLALDRVDIVDGGEIEMLAPEKRL